MRYKRPHYDKETQSGFTLIELLMVISIIGLLSSIVFVSAQNFRASARDTKRIQEIRTLHTAIFSYYLDTNTFPLVGGGGSVATDGATFYWLEAESDDAKFNLGEDGLRSWAQFIQELGPYLSTQTIQDPSNGGIRTDGTRMRYDYYVNVNSSNTAFVPSYFIEATCVSSGVSNGGVALVASIAAYLEVFGNANDFLRWKECGLPNYTGNEKTVQRWILQ